MLVCGDVIRPSPAWLLTPMHEPGTLSLGWPAPGDPAGVRCPGTQAWSAKGPSTHTYHLSWPAAGSAIILAAKGGLISDITIGDCLELLRIADDLHGSAGARLATVLLPAAPHPGSASTPATHGGAGTLRTQGPARSQATDSTGAQGSPPGRSVTCWWTTCGNASRPSTTPPLHKLSPLALGRAVLARSGTARARHRLPCGLNAETAAAWKQRITTKSTRPENGDGEISPVTVTGHRMQSST